MNAGNETVMEQVGPEKLLEIAHQLASNGERFHNHVLSADCEFNDRGQCALILEASDRNQVFVTYSDEPMMDVGRSLASLVHGADALEGSINENQEGDSHPDSSIVGEMMRRARDLMKRGVHWHHHILFPECVFNPHPGSWTIVFEDPGNDETLQSVTPDKPTKDIQITETLFFSQSVHS
ncbi:MAG: hypothetical protein CL481_01240 [Acidobacteria bacterium]|nr:hypothetical protein [Acidobacteriota bacterium]